MNIQCLIKPNKDHHKKWVEAFALGLVAYGGETFSLTTSHDAIGIIEPHTDLVVFWSMNWPAVITYCRKNNIPFICLEMGYIDRNNFTSVNLNGHNGRSQLKVPANDLRSKKYNWKSYTQKAIGDKIVIMGQIPGDKSLEGADVHKWGYETYKKYEKKGLDVYYKPHPLDRSEIPYNMDRFEGSLEETFKEAGMVITYSSNSAVDCWVNGVIATAHSPVSMVWQWQHLRKEGWSGLQHRKLNSLLRRWRPSDR